MKYFLFVVFTSLLVCSLHSAYAQKSKGKCRVLELELNGKYKGDCKDGLANGKGAYTFENRKIMYVGAFENGKMNGEGEMFSILNGNKNLVKKGIWKDNIFIENPSENQSKNPYTVLNSTFVDRFQLAKVRDGNEIRMNIFQNGRRLQTVESLFVNTSSGMESISNYHAAFENIEFPFVFEVVYVVPSKLSTGTSRSMFKVQINEPGIWQLNLYN